MSSIAASASAATPPVYARQPPLLQRVSLSPSPALPRRAAALFAAPRQAFTSASFQAFSFQPSLAIGQPPAFAADFLRRQAGRFGQAFRCRHSQLSLSATPDGH